MNQEAAVIQGLAAVWEMGPICDCTREHLSTSDKALIFSRRLMLRKLAEMDVGKRCPRPAPDSTSGSARSPGACPRLDPWQDALRYQEHYGRDHPEAAGA